MSFLIFTNPGTIDPVSMLTFGISAKDNESAIGMFGTGLKYAIAVLLRNNYKIKIYSGDKYYEFDTKNHEVRSKQFDIVTMNGESVSFTTELGKFWEPWMAIRELACNAIDEHGEWSIANSFHNKPNTTTIVVSGHNIEELYAESKQIFVSGPIIVNNPACQIISKSNEWIYYRGIRALKLDRPSRHTYNILSKVQLTEDRTIKYSWDVTSNVISAVNECDNPQLIRSIVSAANDTWESGLSWSYLSKPSETMLAVIAEMASRFEKIPEALKDACSISLIALLSDKEDSNLDAIDLNRLNKAIKFCKKLGYSIDDYPVKVSDHLGNGVLGRAVDGKIYISRRTFSMGTKMLAGTLMEEYLHLSEGVYDETRAMQNLLIDTIISLGERVTGEVL